MHVKDHDQIRKLFDDYLRMYATRDDRLTAYFSEDFSGFTGGGDFLVKDRAAWVAITRQDFAQIKEAIRIELKDLSIQSLAGTIAVATGFFTIHLPIQDHVLSRETARLVLIFREEPGGWKISHSSISIPYDLVGEGEVYPLKELTARNAALEELVAERTQQLSEANRRLRQANDELANEITGHKLAVKSLQSSEDRYRSILNASPDDITITDQAGRILMVSPMAIKMFGCGRREEFFGRSILDFIVPEDRERALAQIALKRQGIATRATVYRGLRLDGSTFDIEVNSEFIRDATGSPSGMVVIVRDITERKQAEAETEKLKARNRQLQKAESLGCMAGAIAHIFNNQLAAVIGNLELAMLDLPAGTEAVQSLTLALQAANEAAAVSGQMRTYLGQTFFPHETLDLSEICRQGLSVLRVALPKNVPLELHLPGSGPNIRANADHVKQILTNLITNAWEAGSDAGKVIRLSVTTIAPEKIPTAHRLPVDRAPQAASYACLEVADAGCGISGQDIEKIFDPFFSSKFAGRGMGLAVVLGIVRAHDGFITVKSDPGQGSVFQVFLPVSAGAVPLGSAMPAITAPGLT
ncbi:MAG: PAS domain S-box protein [Verrucomicrobiae bacterium]|nr:PAS domain S-box protein [Verrucomicrobiae bacterium]